MCRWDRLKAQGCSSAQEQVAVKVNECCSTSSFLCSRLISCSQIPSVEHLINFCTQVLLFISSEFSIQSGMLQRWRRVKAGTEGFNHTLQLPKWLQFNSYGNTNMRKTNSWFSFFLTGLMWCNRSFWRENTATVLQGQDTPANTCMCCYTCEAVCTFTPASEGQCVLLTTQMWTHGTKKKLHSTVETDTQHNSKLRPQTHTDTLKGNEAELKQGSGKTTKIKQEVTTRAVTRQRRRPD